MKYKQINSSKCINRNWLDSSKVYIFSDKDQIERITLQAERSKIIESSGSTALYTVGETLADTIYNNDFESYCKIYKDSFKKNRLSWCM